MAGTALINLFLPGTKPVSGLWAISPSEAICVRRQVAPIFTRMRLPSLAKGNVSPPSEPIVDVIDWRYTGNRLHPTQKPVARKCRPLGEYFPENGVLTPAPRAGSVGAGYPFASYFS
jgi:hypothetical protein